ncbi:hypothetical protein J4526_05955 [Desulfurococcaceae archaeon MEX13E-LK6-19]|nr:hypothetical protein J4526_05955 [Desulfurococcaceae archaeon MEX13E-LK6-19]
MCGVILLPYTAIGLAAVIVVLVDYYLLFSCKENSLTLIILFFRNLLYYMTILDLFVAIGACASNA